MKEFDQNNNVKGRSLGKKRVVEPLKGAIQLDTGSNKFINCRGSYYCFKARWTSLCHGR